MKISQIFEQIHKSTIALQALFFFCTLTIYNILYSYSFHSYHICTIYKFNQCIQILPFSLVYILFIFLLQFFTILSDMFNSVFRIFLSDSIFRSRTVIKSCLILSLSHLKICFYWNLFCLLYHIKGGKKIFQDLSFFFFTCHFNRHFI